MQVDPKKVIEIASWKAFDRWLAKHWDVETEVWIRIYKVRSGVASITPAEAVDVVLCWGWIDGIRKGLDDVSFLQRYSPRTKKSPWSQINVANVARLTEAGRMRPSGLAQVAAAKADGRWEKAYRMASDTPPADLLKAIGKDPKAQATYEKLSKQNRFALSFRLLSLKTDEARKKKIAALVAMLASGKTLHPNGKT